LRFSKKKSSPNFLDLILNNVEDEPKENNKKDSGTCNNHGKEHYTEVARKLCRLIEEEDAKESRWERKNTFHSESFEEIFVEFGSTSFFFVLITRDVRASLRVPRLIPGSIEHPASPVGR